MQQLSFEHAELLQRSYLDRQHCVLLLLGDVLWIGSRFVRCVTSKSWENADSGREHAVSHLSVATVCLN